MYSVSEMSYLEKEIVGNYLCGKFKFGLIYLTITLFFEKLFSYLSKDPFEKPELKSLNEKVA